MDKVLSALSLARKAGALVQGFDSVADSVYKGTACLVLLASDLSDRTRRKMLSVCEEEAVPAAELPYTQSELLSIARKATGIFAVCDENFAKLCAKQLDEN